MKKVKWLKKQSLVRDLMQSNQSTGWVKFLLGMLVFALLTVIYQEATINDPSKYIPVLWVDVLLLPASSLFLLIKMDLELWRRELLITYADLMITISLLVGSYAFSVSNSDFMFPMSWFLVGFFLLTIPMMGKFASMKPN